jgi:hypothetical protein
MTSGLSPLRIATPVHNELEGTLTEWSHFVGRGIQPVGADLPNVPRFDVLAGPLNTSFGPMAVENVGGSLRLRLENGSMYLRGRWIVPTTRRQRAITGGGTTAVTEQTLIESMLTSPCEVGATLVHEGTLAVYSGPNKDILMYPAGHSETPGTPIKIVLRHLKIDAACATPDTSPACELPECHDLMPGNYYVITTNEFDGRQTITRYPWNITGQSGVPTAHDPHARALITQINQRIGIVNIPSVMKTLDPLVP